MSEKRCRKHKWIARDDYAVLMPAIGLNTLRRTPMLYCDNCGKAVEDKGNKPAVLTMSAFYWKNPTLDRERQERMIREFLTTEPTS